MAIASSAIATAAAMLACAGTLCAADAAPAPPAAPLPAGPPSSKLRAANRSSGHDDGEPVGVEDALFAEEVGSYGEPTDGPVEEPMEAPVQVVPGPAAAEPEGGAGGAPAPGPGDLSAEEGDLQLVRRRVMGDPAFVEGALQVFVDGAFGAVCNTRFDDTDASVACQQLGFSGGEATTLFNILTFSDFDLERDEDIVAPFVLENLNCTGTEERLVDCPVATETGFDEYLLEEYFYYRYTSVGAQTGGCDAIQSAGYTAVRCGPLTGSEASELRQAIGGDSDVGEADRTPGAEEGDVRLVEETAVDNWRVGRLELFLDGSFAPVCPGGFSIEDATVACRGLGLGAAAVAPRAPEGTFEQTRLNNFDRQAFLRATGQLVAASGSTAGGPNCDGTESGLLECDGARSGGDCTFAVLIACVAEEEAGVEGALRLTTTGEGDINNDPEAGVGIVEVFHAGAWGTLCNGDPAAVIADYDYGTPDDSLTEEAALVACRQLGFKTGEFRGIQRLPEDVARRPAWLADLPCATGTEASILDCGDLAFGDTFSCGLTQRLLCSDGDPEFPLLTPRLVESEIDPNGQWTYGRLEVFDGLAFIPVSDFGGGQELGRRGVQVACRELGFATGGQALAGSESALPLPKATGRDNRIGDIICDGDEATLAECDNAFSGNRPVPDLNDYDNYERSVEENAVALVCYNPSGCEANSSSTGSAPQQGDIRLVSLPGNDNPTQPCDVVHLGGVEFFNDGQWGRLCVAGLRTRSTWTVDATVACRQLGFPFGSLMDNRERLFFDGDVESAGTPTWASIVFCKGTEERLDECSFIEDFGRAGTDIVGRPNLAEVDCSDEDIVSVICRRFPMEESDVIRRL